MSIKKNGVDEKVKVVCRVRPFLDHEAPDDSVVVEGNEIKITNQRNQSEIVSFRQVSLYMCITTNMQITMRCRFSSCHGPDSTQAEIYEHDVQPLIDRVFSGVVGTHTPHRKTSTS
jgi:kinesin family protein 22